MNKRIFIVEDEIIVARDIKNILEKNNFNVVGLATRYNQALENIPKVNPDLVLCDINLREKHTGIELIKQLKDKHNFSVIFISAYADQEYLRSAKTVNPINFLTKPFNDQQLLTSVRMALLPNEIDSSGEIEAPTKRELQIIKLIARGFSNEEIGKELYISMFTAKTHRRNLLKKYSLKNTAELVAFSVKQNWV